ncbi:MAG: MFS transporter, partial [Anaerolineaceae bacterium]
DKFGPKKVLIVSTLLVGLLGAVRGLSPNYGLLLVTVVLVGAFMPFVFLNGIKTIGQWFPNSQLGLANGVVTMAMALGFFLGSILSASVMSPWLGGWRNVFIFYGLIGAFLCIPWFFTRSAPITKSATGQSVSMLKSIQYVIKVKNIWIIGMVMFCMAGAIQGVMG